VVADLLFDLGNVLALTRTVEHAAAVYAKALEYGPRDRELVTRRLEAARRRSGGWLYRWQLAVLVGLVLVGCTAAARVWRRNRARSAPAARTPD
jgi:hypothetical protein